MPSIIISLALSLGKRISTISKSTMVSHDHKLLVKMIERLVEDRKCDLSRVQQPFIDQVFSVFKTILITFTLIDKVGSLIDVCLNYYVLPRIDIPKGELRLRGDRESCTQCFANLQKQRLIHQYNIYCNTGKGTEEIELNLYVSMKIDETLAIGDSKVND
jgi:hypothetical protein